MCFVAAIRTVVEEHDKASRGIASSFIDGRECKSSFRGSWRLTDTNRIVVEILPSDRSNSTDRFTSAADNGSNGWRTLSGMTCTLNGGDHEGAHAGLSAFDPMPIINAPPTGQLGWQIVGTVFRVIPTSGVNVNGVGVWSRIWSLGIWLFDCDLLPLDCFERV